MNNVPRNFKSYRQIILFVVLFATLVLIVLTQANPGTELPNRDYGFYIYIGKLIAKGQMPYLDAWDSKPPAIFYLNAFALSLGRGYRWGVWLVEFVFLFCAVNASYYLMKKLWGMAPALFGVFVWLWGMDFTLQGGNYTEEYPLVFHFLALILLLSLIQQPRQRFFNLTLGALFSFSFLFRPNNALVEAVTILILGLTHVWRRDFKSFFIAVLWVTLGIVIPLAAVSAYFAYHGLFYEMFEASILYNFAYSSTQLSQTSPLTVGFEFLKLSAWGGLVGYGLVVAKLKKLFQSPYMPLYAVLLVGTPAAVFLSDLAKRNYGHYFINWLPFIGLLSAFAFYTLLETLNPREEGWQASNFPQISSLPLYALIAAILALVLTGRASTYVKAFDRLFTTSDREMRSPIAIYVDNHTNPGEYVVFWATNPGENFMAHRNAPYAGLYYPHLVKSGVADRLNAAYLEDLKLKKPVLIVDMARLTIPSLDPAKREEQKSTGVYLSDPPDNLDEVLIYIEENYYLEAVIKDKPIYRLNGTSEP